MQRPDQTWTQGKDSFLPSLGRLLDDAWPYGPKDHWLKTTWVSAGIEMKARNWPHKTLGSKMPPKRKECRRVFRSTSRQEHPCSTYMISFFSRKIDTCFHYFSYFYIFCQKRAKKRKKTRKTKKNREKQNDLKKHFLNWKPNAGYPTGAKPKRKKMKKKSKRKTRHKKKIKKTCHRFAICIQSPLCNSCLENCSQKSCCSDLQCHFFTCLWFMSCSHVYGSCWTVWNGFAIFLVGVSTQSPLPGSCLEYGGLQCSHVFYCFHSWFISFPGAFKCVISFHLFSFMFIYFHFFLFSVLFIFFHVLLFFSLEKNLPI